VKMHLFVLYQWWLNFNESSAPRSSWFRFTGLSRIVALVALIELVFLSPMSWSAVAVYDASAEMSLSQILVLTQQVLQQVSQTQTNTTTMKQIQDGRQGVSYGLAMMQSLGQFGRMLADNPLQDMVSTVNQFMSRQSSMRRSNSQWAAFINRQPSWNDLTFNGSSFQGGNGGFIDNVASYEGVPVSANRDAPKMIFSISDTARQLLSGAYQVRDYVSELQGLGNNFSRLFGDNNAQSPVAKQMVGDGIFLRAAQPLDNLYIAKVQKGTAVTRMEFYGLSDGLNQYGWRYDPITGVKDGRAALAERFSQTNTLSAGAWAAIERYNQAQVESVEAPVANPYYLYAYRVTPALLASVGSFTPGERIEVPKDIVDSAAYGPPQYDTKVSDASNRARELDTLVPHRLKERLRNDCLVLVQYVPQGQTVYQGYMLGRPYPNDGNSFAGSVYMNGINVSPSNVPPNYNGRQVAVVLPSLRECEQYFNQIAGNDLLLSQNLSFTGLTSKMMEYVNLVAKALGILRQGLNMLRQMADRNSSLEGVTQALATIDQTLQHMQGQVYQYTSKVTGLLDQRQAILGQRHAIVTATEASLRRNAEDRLFGNTLQGYQHAYSQGSGGS